MTKSEQPPVDPKIVSGAYHIVDSFVASHDQVVPWPSAPLVILHDDILRPVYDEAWYGTTVVVVGATYLHRVASEPAKQLGIGDTDVSFWRTFSHPHYIADEPIPEDPYMLPTKALQGSEHCLTLQAGIIIGDVIEKRAVRTFSVDGLGNAFCEEGAAMLAVSEEQVRAIGNLAGLLHARPTTELLANSSASSKAAF